MRKVYKAVNEFLPYAIILLLIADSFLNATDDVSRGVMNMLAIIGWISFIEVRKDYNTLNDMIMGITKDESQG